MPTSSLSLVTAQLALIAALAATGPLVPAGMLPRALLASGALLAAWAVAAIPPRHLRATPEPARGARLVTAGPFRAIRHPMYTSVLLASLGWVTGDWTWWRGALWLALLAVLLAKLHLEEHLLRATFPDYATYAARTHRLVPGLY